MAELTEKQQEDSYEFLQHKKRAFLAAYSECGNITRAAEMAEIHRTTHYDWLASDPNYVEAFKHADESAGDRLEQEARRRAVDGVDEPVYHQGQVVGTVRKYSDSLLIFLLKGTKPDKYKERVQSDTNIKGELKHDVQVQHDLSKLSVEELKNLESILSKTTPDD